MPENKVFSHLAIKVMSCLAGIQDGLLKDCAFRGKELMLRIWQLHKGELHSSVANLTLGIAA